MKFIKSNTRQSPLFLLRFLLVGCFLVLAILARNFPYFALDLQISETIQSIRHPLFSVVMNLVSELGDDYHLGIIVSLAVVLLLFAEMKMEALKAALFAAVSALAGTFIKLIVARPRPNSQFVQIQEIFSDKSFPSLHVLIFTAFFGYMFYLALARVKTTWLKALLAFGSAFLILTIGVSRIYLGAHWASDTLGGYLVGAFFISYISDHAKR